MKKLIEQIVKYIVDHPADVKINELCGEKTHLYELRLNKEDVGKVIGKGGKTVSSIRNLISTLSARNGKRSILEVVE